MKIRYLSHLIVAVSLFALYGCPTHTPPSNPPETVTTIRGVVSKGIFVNGKVRVYALNTDGSVGTLLQTVGINPDGTYAAFIVSYKGPVIVAASGDYKDEATGAIKTVPEDQPLRAAVQHAEGEVKVAVTTLTEMAVKKVEDPASKIIAVSSISSTNTLIADVFHVADILSTMPVDVTVPIPVDPAADQLIVQKQKEYALALAAISQMMATEQKDLLTIITDLKNSITDADASLLTGAALDFQTALQTFASDPNKNMSGITDVTSTNLVNVGGSTATIKLKTIGSGTTLNGIQVTLTLPSGVTVKAENGKPLTGLVTASGVIPDNSLVVARYLPGDRGTLPIMPAQLIVAVENSTSFGAGEFITIKCDVAPGVSISNASFDSANFTDYKPVDGFGVSILDLYSSLTAEVN